jgi:hypothetical protein
VASSLQPHGADADDWRECGLLLGPLGRRDAPTEIVERLVHVNLERPDVDIRHAHQVSVR